MKTHQSLKNNTASNNNHTQPLAFGCTSLKINDRQGNVYHGRTLEYSWDLPTSIVYYPKNVARNYLAPDNKTQAISYKTKYESICIAATYENYVVPTEGVNSAGLSVSLNMKTDSDLPNLPVDKYPTSMPWFSIPEWALSNCASIDDLKKQLKGISFWTLTIGVMSSSFHYAFYDTSGASLVVEISDNKVHVMDNPTGVLTNGPEFTWHLTNLHNYTHLTNLDTNVTTMGGMQLKQPDSGIATAGLPSSDTSVGRFVRGVFYSTHALLHDSADKALMELSHIMNKFDRPKNMTNSNQGEGGETGNSIVSEYTLWTSLTDLLKKEIYVRTYYEINYHKYTLEQFKSETQIVKIPIIE